MARNRSRGAALGVAVVALVLLCSVRAWSGSAPPSTLIGDAGGWRDRLARLGLTVQLFSNHFGSWHARGGVDHDDELGHSGSYDFFVLADLDELAGLSDSTILLRAKGQYDRSVNDDVGALSDPVDDADFDEAIYVSELWAERGFLDRLVRVRLGLLEQQTVFDRNAHANSEDRQFMAAFLDNSAVVPLPSALGAVAILQPASWLELAVGTADADNRPRRSGFDTAFDGIDSLTSHLEATVRIRPGRQGLPGSYRLGVFRDGRDLQVFGRPGATERGHWGVYLSCDQLLTREAGSQDQGLGAFARFGAADEDVNRIAWFGSVGFQYAGLLPGRNSDVLGLGAYQAIASGRYRDAVDSDFDRETGVEIYYSAELRPWLTATPDLQIIFDPGGADASTAVIATLRLRVAF